MTAYAYVLDNVCATYGWQVSPTGATEIETQANQMEVRNALGDELRHYFSLPFQNITEESYELYLKHVFVVMYARTHSFLVLDELDHEGEMESLGTAPAGTAAVQLRKGYHIRDRQGNVLASRYRNITKPDEDSVVVYQDNGSGTFVAKPGTVDPTTGLFTPSTSWVAGRALRASFRFWVPVRFDNDELPMAIAARNAAGYRISGSVNLVEVFGE